MQNAYPLGAEAQDMQGYGRNGDTMLMHVSPEEVSGLQALAQNNGTSLTINPHTGMPEAFSLKKLLPTIAGIGLSFVPGVGPLLAAGLTAAVSTAASGSLKKGLMAGLQAYGGAALGGALGAGSVFGAGAGASAGVGAGVGAAEGLASNVPVALNAAPGAVSGLVPTATSMGNIGASLGTGAVSAAAPAAASAAQLAAGYTPAFSASLPAAAPAAAPLTGIPKMLGAVSPQLGAQAQQFGSNFAAQASRGLPAGILSKAAPYAAGAGLMQGVSGAFAPKMPKATAENNFNYEGPYTAPYREVSYPTNRDPNDSSEYLYFRNTNPVPGYVPYSKAFPARQTVDMEKRLREEDYGFAKGGMRLEDGAFIVDARTVSELGNGSSGAGQERLKQLGGQSIKGGGDGVSDSIRANIGGRQEARVARDEVKFSPQAVARIGRGNQKRGADKLYALMAKAEKARKSAKRGQDTGLASLLGA
jgi:hypothetical protein